jgi:hypothetical protein
MLIRAVFVMFWFVFAHNNSIHLFDDNVTTKLFLAFDSPWFLYLFFLWSVVVQWSLIRPLTSIFANRFGFAGGTPHHTSLSGVRRAAVFGKSLGSSMPSRFKSSAGATSASQTTMPPRFLLCAIVLWLMSQRRASANSGRAWLVWLERIARGLDAVSLVRANDVCSRW